MNIMVEHPTVGHSGTNIANRTFAHMLVSKLEEWRDLS